MSGVAVGDDGGQIVDLRPWILPGEDGGCALFVLTAVVMELCPYELIACALGCFANETGSINASVHGIKPLCTPWRGDRLTFLGHCIHGVICEIRTRFIRRTCGARALPSADVNTAQICARTYERERERNAKRRGFRKVTTVVAKRRRDSEYDSTHAGPFGRPGSDPMHRRCGNIRRRNGERTGASRASWTRRSRRSTWATLTRRSVPMQRDGGRPLRRLLRRLV